MELPFSIKKSVNKYEPIKTHGLTLYPVLVEEYDSFLISRPALEVLHQSLPVAMMRMPLLSAYYQMDYEAMLNNQPISGLFTSALIGLVLSLRIGEGKELGERLKCFRIAVDTNDPSKLVSLRFTDADGIEKTIDAPAYKELREIIAAQNGVKVESDSANPDIVQARKDMETASAEYDFSVDALINFASALSGKDESEIYEWPILKLTRHTDAYQTMLAYLICGIGEASGATWKNGNPVPHPIFNRKENRRGFASPLPQSEQKTASGASIQHTSANADVQAIETQIAKNRFQKHL